MINLDHLKWWLKSKSCSHKWERRTKSTGWFADCHKCGSYRGAAPFGHKIRRLLGD